MLFDQSNELLEIIRSSFFAYLIIALPIVVVISPSCLAAKEFPAFRLQQFELHGTSYGTTGSILNLETRIVPGSPIVSSPRRCYVVKLIDLTVAMYLELLRNSVAGVLVIVPSELNSLNESVREQIHELESTMLEESTAVPVYFVQETGDILEMYETVKRSAESQGKISAAQTILQHIHGNGVQLVSSLGVPKSITDVQIVSIQGSLVGTKGNKNFPVLLSAHYDSLSPAAELSFGADSNGSGTAALLELARLFSHIYHTRNSLGMSKSVGRPLNSMLFLLSGGGQFNYQGTQKYLEDQVDSTDHSDLQDTRLVVCLDSLTANPNELYIHVARTIREGTVLSSFIKNLIEVAEKLNEDLKIEVVHKKIRTESLLSWEHEKYHLKKINALTLSSHANPTMLKSSMLDRRENVDIKDLAMKIHVIAEALAATIFNVSGAGNAFYGTLGVSEESMASTLEYITSEPRSAQLLATKQNKFVLSLQSLLSRYTHETQLHFMKPDKRDANLVFYDSTSGIITSYDVKPAVFDLVLSIVIACYLSIIFLAVKNFPKFYDAVSCDVSASSGSNGTSGNHSHIKSN